MNPVGSPGRDVARTATARSLERPAFCLLLAVVAASACASVAQATPSTTYWAPSTASCQAWRVLHVTYDTYFGKGPAAGSPGALNYPIDLGLTTGFLPLSKVQGELGYDLLLPSEHPSFLNAKLCSPEGAWFSGSPGVSFGIYNVGFEKGVTDYNVLHLMFQKSLPGGGYVAVGDYHGLSKTLFTNSQGEVVRTGLMAAVFSPTIPVCFTDSISLLTGPVFFLDEALQPGGRGFLWTAQIDVHIPLRR